MAKKKFLKADEVLASGKELEDVVAEKIQEEVSDKDVEREAIDFILGEDFVYRMVKIAYNEKTGEARIKKIENLKPGLHNANYAAVNYFTKKLAGIK